MSYFGEELVPNETRYLLSTQSSRHRNDRPMTHTHAHTHTHMHAVCEHEDVTVLWHQGLHIDREITVNRPDIIIKTRKDKNMRTDGCGSTCGKKCT
jgi:hypothetical protein